MKAWPENKRPMNSRQFIETGNAWILQVLSLGKEGGPHMKLTLVFLFILLLIMPALLGAQQQRTVNVIKCGDGFITKPMEQCDPRAELRENNGCPIETRCIKCQCVKEGAEKPKAPEQEPGTAPQQ